ncbi:MAG: GNAT family N-acetyltransferase [Syntrophomonas sp.]
MDITYRSAQNNDCPILAEYIYFAAEGVLDYLFKDTIPGITVTQLLTFGLEDEQRYNSYKGIVVAEYSRQIIGMIQAYSNIHHRIKEFYDSRIDNSLLINAIYVDEKFRRQGIANQLISMVREEARSLGFDKLSLFVFADNIPAQKLYYSNGFKTLKEIAFNDSAKIDHEGNIHVMACDI